LTNNSAITIRLGYKLTAEGRPSAAKVAAKCGETGEIEISKKMSDTDSRNDGSGNTIEGAW